MHALRRLGGMAALVLMGSPAIAQDGPRVVAVSPPLQYFAERLLDGTGEVVYPVPDGVDPSFWRPSIADISAVQSADLIMLNGAGFAAWTSKVSLPRSKTLDTSRGLEDQFIATQSITHSHGEGGTHSHDAVASYTWLDLSLATEQARAVADALKARGLADPEVVDARMDGLATDLRAADAEARDMLRDAGQTVFIATHPRYQYLARAYGLTILSVEWDAGAMPGAEDLAELETMAAQSGASVLIWEAPPPAGAEQAVAALGLESSIFPPLAAPQGQGGFLESFAASIAGLADAARRSGGG